LTVIAVLAAILVASAAPAVPSRIDAEYRISSGGLVIGHVTETFERDGEHYRIESVTRSEGALKLFLDDTATLRSEGRVGPGGLVPLRFEQRRARDSSRDIRARFDWETGRLHSEYRGEERTEALPPGTQDRLSVLYQFMNMGAPADEVRMPMSNGRKVEHYAYRKVGEERLRTPAGEFDTLHYERVTESAGESRAELWLAKDRHMLPVRVRFDDSRGLRLEQSLVSLAVR
jgi:hypothetical protein